MKTKKRILFDNNEISFIANNIDFFKKLKNEYELCISKTVVRELAAIPDKNIEFRKQIFVDFSDLEFKFLPDSCFVLNGGFTLDGRSNMGNCEVYNKIININGDNINDAVIADTAVTHKCILLTEDKELLKKMAHNNYVALSLSKLKELNNL